MKTKILEILRQAEKGAFISGQELCGQLGVSRTAIWKSVKQLKDAGYKIEAIQNKGYRLLSAPDILSKSEIESQLQTKWAGRPICYFDEIDSTNTEAKRIAEGTAGAQGHGTVVVAEEQNAGRGRRGRDWDSPRGDGIFFTILLKPDMDPSNAPMLTLVKALATAKGIAKSTGLAPAIKWPNDVVVNGKKVVGILTEMSAQVDYINHIVVGTGINVHQKGFPEEIAAKATSLDLELKQLGKRKKIYRAALLAAILGEFESCYEAFMQTQDLSALMEEYNSLLVNCGKEVRVLDPLGEFGGKALGINERGELLVDCKGEIKKISSGEVSVRGIYGYV